MKNKTTTENEKLAHFQFDLEEHMSTLRSLASVCEETGNLVKKLTTGKAKARGAVKDKIRQNLESLEWFNWGNFSDSQESEVDMLKEMYETAIATTKPVKA